jgi:hypothetical protein
VKSRKVAARPEQGFLSNIFGICASAQQPACQVEGGIDVGEHQLLEADAVFKIELAQNSPRCVKLMIRNRLNWSFIPCMSVNYPAPKQKFLVGWNKCASSAVWIGEMR